MRVTIAKYALIDSDGKPTASTFGWPMLVLHLDDKVARVGNDQKLLRYGLPLVFLGAEWEQSLPAIRLPKDAIQPGLPNADMELRGYSDDPSVVNLARRFLADCEKGDFQPGTIDLST